MAKKTKRSKEYKQMMKKHKKALDLIHKGARRSPWEWSWLLDYMVEVMRFMQDYYNLGENVWAMEDCDAWAEKKGQPTRLQSLTETLDHYDNWAGCEDKYITLVRHPETYKSHPNKDGTVTIDDLGCHLEYKLGTAEETYKVINEEMDKEWTAFFECFKKYLMTWWD